mmetsp:Transcript_6622/g.8182  ORF Transcript_6622/g.8182 Transcript_6622/m.8182 type:complete len:141 (-) Transcript_6622:42-464(-)
MLPFLIFISIFITIIYGNNTTSISSRVISPFPTEKPDTNFWGTAVMMIAFICACVCLERLYSSFMKVYRKRKGIDGFSRIANTDFDEFYDDDDDVELNRDTNDINMNNNINTNKMENNENILDMETGNMDGIKQVFTKQD